MSKGEDELGTILHDEYHQKVIPQFPIKAYFITLFLDYYIPALKLAFEVDGVQHAAFSKFFHGDRQGFEHSQHNDRIKEQWCNSHGITLIRFSHKDKITVDTLRRKISEEAITKYG